MATPSALAAKAASAAAGAAKATAVAARHAGRRVEAATISAAAAALSAAALSLQVEADDITEVDSELRARQRLAQPALRERIAAGKNARAPQLRGAQRAQRNLAEHHLLGIGAEAILDAAEHLQRSQRGGCRRQRRGNGDDSAEGSTTASASAGEHERAAGPASATYASAGFSARPATAASASAGGEAISDELDAERPANSLTHMPGEMFFIGERAIGVQTDVPCEESSASNYNEGQAVVDMLDKQVQARAADFLADASTLTQAPACAHAPSPPMAAACSAALSIPTDEVSSSSRSGKGHSSAAASVMVAVAKDADGMGDATEHHRG